MIWERVPLIRRVRRHIPVAWLELLLGGRNRQVRRMTAAVGLPDARLVRFGGPLNLTGLLQPGWREASEVPPEPAGAPDEDRLNRGFPQSTPV